VGRGLQPCCRAELSHIGGTFAAGGALESSPSPVSAASGSCPSRRSPGSAVVEPRIQSRPFTPALGFPDRKVSNGVSVKAILIPPDGTRVCCFALGRRQGSCVLSPSESHFLLMRAVLRAAEGCVRGPTLPLYLEPFYPRCWQNSANNALRKSPMSFFFHEQGAA